MGMVPCSCYYSPLGVSYAHEEVVELSTYRHKKGILHFFPEVYLCSAIRLGNDIKTCFYKD